MGWGAGFPTGGRQLYWHVISGGSIGGILNPSAVVFTSPGVQDVHLHVTAIGNTYSVYVDGSATPATTLVDNSFGSGRVGLYDFSSQTFDNFTVAVPEPTVFSLATMGMAVFCVRRIKRRQ
jgi:hypothetical protein